MPNSAGIGPVNRLPPSFKLRTRPLILVSTPYHSPIGKSLVQLSLLRQSGPSVALYSAISAARSSDGAPASGAASQRGKSSWSRSLLSPPILMRQTAGMQPVSKLRSRCSSCRLSKPPSPAGIRPVNRLLLRDNRCRMPRLPNSAGSSPVSKLSLICKLCRFWRLPNCDGIVPANRLLSRFNNSRLERLPSSGGMAPANRLLWRVNRRRLDRLPSPAGSSPCSKLLPSANSTTRPS